MIVPIPTQTEDTPDYDPVRIYEKPEIPWYAQVPDWKCIECGAVHYGKTLACVYCKQVLKKHTPRPSTAACLAVTPR